MTEAGAGDQFSLSGEIPGVAVSVSMVYSNSSLNCVRLTCSFQWFAPELPVSSVATRNPVNYPRPPVVPPTTSCVRA
jgi:hypothetical protein